MDGHSLLANYHEQTRVWDEMFSGAGIRSAYQHFVSAIEDLSADELTHKDELAKKLFMSQGITFTVYSSGEGIEKIFPFDIIPRILEAAEWKHIEAGIKQRLKALNIFLKDIYHQQFIIKDGLLLTADWKATDRLVLSLNLIYSYFEGEFWSRNFSFVAGTDNTNANTGRSTVGGDGMLTVIAPPRTATANVAGVVNGSGTSAKLAYTRQIAPRFEYKIGSWVVDGAVGLSRAVNNYEALERGFANNEAGTLPAGWTAIWRENTVLKLSTASSWIPSRSS